MSSVVWATPRLCLMAWLLQPAAWAVAAFQLTRAGWAAGLSMMALFSLVFLPRLGPQLAKGQSSMKTVNVVLGAMLMLSTVTALLFGEISLATWLGFVAPCLWWLWKDQVRSLATWGNIATRLLLAAAVSAGSPLAVGAALALELGMTAFGRGGFWAQLEKKGTREEFLLKSGAFCQAGGG